ncbi:hypothetical protein C0Q70_17791 [Pomacea canaliculata]|uniref:Fibrinogen C-terminal domain-containing protein n=1 Tax=Pomacea canaliculata TaxID=400727 RepID=A0A2T7NLE3_POMCA|nr:uncharacterized protein LOC112575504 [Pomacea canaliculata]PVD21988.1 hypothetical protein C0Q70_17791 [Pomacea canaliculata]
MTALFLLTPVFLRLTLSSELSASTSRYIRRPDDDLYVGPVLNTVVARSTLTCAAMCSRNDRCHVINVCPCDGFPRQVECSLHDEESFEVSNFLKDVALQNCFLWEKLQSEEISEVTVTPTVDTTEELQCENGGTLVGGRCQCRRQYGGTTCQRLIRDCTEPYDNGYRTSRSVPLLIQPAGAITPFWILCLLNNGGFNYILIRNGIMSSNVSWATAKTGIGDTTMTDSSNFFIGLENLHNLLSQADYFATVYCHFDSNPSEGWLTYESFVVGPESSSYALSYESVNSAQTEFLDNVFNDSALLFSTFDHDPNSCKKGYPGWFGSDCAESPPFADSVVWPVNGEPKNVDYLFIQVFRSSNFNVN